MTYIPYFLTFNGFLWYTRRNLCHCCVVCVCICANLYICFCVQYVSPCFWVQFKCKAGKTQVSRSYLLYCPWRWMCVFVCVSVCLSPVKQTGHLKVPPMPSKLCSIRWQSSLAGESNIWLHSLHSWLMPSSANRRQTRKCRLSNTKKQEHMTSIQNINTTIMTDVLHTYRNCHIIYWWLRR